MLAKPGIKVDWDRAKAKLNTEWVTVRIAGMVAKLEKTGRCSAAWQKAENQMRKEGIPTRKQLEVRVPSTIPKSPLYQELRREITLHKLPVGLTQWVSSNLKIVHVPLGTYADKRHGAAVVRDAKMEDVWRDMDDLAEQVHHGVGFERIAGSARVPERPTMAIQTAAAWQGVYELRAKLRRTFAPTLPAGRVRLTSPKPSWVIPGLAPGMMEVRAAAERGERKRKEDERDRDNSSTRNSPPRDSSSTSSPPKGSSRAPSRWPVRTTAAATAAATTDAADAATVRRDPVRNG